MAAYFAVKSGNDRRAKREAFDKVFARFDHNHNGEKDRFKVFFSAQLSGRVFVKEFFDELRQEGFEVDEEEVEKLKAFADGDGQVTRDDFKTYCKHSELFQSLDK